MTSPEDEPSPSGPGSSIEVSLSGDRAGRALGRPIDLAALLVIVTLLVVLTRQMFSGGLLTYSDFYPVFPGATNGQGLSIYLSAWNPGSLGSPSSQPTEYAILSAFSLAGIPPVFLQAGVFEAFLFVGAYCTYLVGRRATKRAYFAVLGPVFYLLTPVLFGAVFDSSANIPFYGLLPAIALVGQNVVTRPGLKPTLCLAGTLGVLFAFVTFSPIYVVPILVSVSIGAWVTSSFRFSWTATTKIVGAWLAGLLANAPFYLGNLSYFAGVSNSPVYSSSIYIAGIAYSWSTPVNVLSGVGSSLYPRYAGYYSGLTISLLILVFTVALIGLLDSRKRSGFGRWIAISLLVISFLWIFLTRLTATYPLFHAIPSLLVLNYPEVFYMMSAYATSILLPISLDTISELSTPKSNQVPTKSLAPNLHSSTSGLLPKTYTRLKTSFSRVVVPVVLIGVVVSLVVPAGFYLETGDFRVIDAPAAIGFPSQWSATGSPSYQSIAEFLDDHGASLQARALILPFPGAAGATQFRPYSVNLFNQPESSATVNSGLFFYQPTGVQFATEVSQYLVLNRTDEIGVLLGTASVKYVIVNLEANFTGPPYWTWGSLVGSPLYFAELLNQQKDLALVCNCSGFLAYENLDYRPYVQAYDEAASVFTGSTAVPQNRTIHSFTLARSNWSIPAPPSRIANISTSPDGYVVDGSSNSGVMNITFEQVNDSGRIVSESNGFTNDGIYILSTAVSVGSLTYALSYDSSFAGPPGLPISGQGYLTINGYNKSGDFLWAVASYSAGLTNGEGTTVPFDPAQLNRSTAEVSIAIAFPHDFGASSVVFSVWDMTLIESLPPPPDPALSSLVLEKLPPMDPAAGALPILMNGSQLNRSGLAVANQQDLVSICIELCSQDSVDPAEQLFYTYDSVAFGPSEVTLGLANGAIAGVATQIAGNATASLAIASVPFTAVGVRMAGMGALDLTLGNVPIGTLLADSPNYRWYLLNLSIPLSGQTVVLNCSGNISLDSILFTDSLEGQGTGYEPSAVEITQSSLSSYQGTIAMNRTTFLVLAQGYNSGWSLSIGGLVIGPDPAFGWANFFVVNGRNGSGEQAFSLVFTPQTVHVALMTGQLVTTVGIVIGILLPSGVVGERLRRAGATTRAWLGRFRPHRSSRYSGGTQTDHSSTKDGR